MSDPTELANEAYERFRSTVEHLMPRDRIQAIDDLVTCLDVYKDEVLDVIPEERAIGAFDF